MLPFPARPELPADRFASGRVSIRFEDIAQDGRLVLEGMAPAIGDVVWAKLLTHSELIKTMRRQGIVPIFTRLVVQGEGGPFATIGPLEAGGGYQLGHTRDASGAVEKIVLDMWIEATLPIGRNYGPAPANAGTRVPAGRLYGEHVLTRLFAPPDQRKVTSFEMDGAPMLGQERAWVRPESVAALPDGAKPLDHGLRRDPTSICFGLAHTDSNQHVNSLVYPRLFEDAAMRRFCEHGRLKPPVLARHVESAFRKPCFAGERYAIEIQAFEWNGYLGAIGAFVDPAEPPGDARRGHCFLRMLFN